MVAGQIGSPVEVKDNETGRGVGYKAEDCFEQAANILREAGLDGERARTLREWAQYELHRGNRDKGLALWQEARDIFVELGAKKEVERMTAPEPDESDTPD